MIVQINQHLHKKECEVSVTDATVWVSGCLIQLVGVRTVLFIVTNFILDLYHASCRHTHDA